MRLHPARSLPFARDLSNRIDDNFRNRPRNGNRAGFRFDDPLVLAVGQFVFQNEMSALGEFGSVRGIAAVDNAIVPLRLFFPFRVLLVSSRCGKRKPSDFLSCLSGEALASWPVKPMRVRRFMYISVSAFSVK